MKVLITGGAGFIGSATAKQLMDRGDRVALIDNFNDYYDPQLKRDRIKIFLKGYRGKPARNASRNDAGTFTLYTGDIRDVKFLEKVFTKERPDKVIHLAAMAGVRNSLEHPALYADINIMGTVNLLELSVKHKIKNFVYASSSSVYGNNKKFPFSEKDNVDTPISPYAATKKADELLAHVYSHIYKLPTTGLRYFTVYGPWGRPDMALFLFTKNIFFGKPILVNNHGKMSRNFTYVDDIASGTIRTLDADLPYAVMNIGGDRENTLLEFIGEIEKNVGKKAKMKMMPLPPGDVISTVADIKKLRKMGWKPTTRIDKGIKNFVEWYREYYKA
ncbi:MAG: GDP-mannose 4,6-dehydratase [bacterium]|nr:GDP-mannose 4,6-dehydratase [bacterium]